MLNVRNLNHNKLNMTKTTTSSNNKTENQITRLFFTEKKKIESIYFRASSHGNCVGKGGAYQLVHGDLRRKHPSLLELP